MKVDDVHERELAAPAGRVGALIDTLSSSEDAIWPRHRWPRMKLDRPLGVGAAGGHGPIRYVVESYEPARLVRFRFTAPRGFDGTHELAVETRGPGACTLRHRLKMHARGPAALTWPIVFGPLHRALIEDALDRAAQAVGDEPRRVRWSAWVRMLRAVLARTPRRRAW
jgi:hypothetical protein